MIVRYVVAEANINLMLDENCRLKSKENEVSYYNLTEAGSFLIDGILIKLDRLITQPYYGRMSTPSFYFEEDDNIWAILNDVSSRITTIIPETAVLIG